MNVLITGASGNLGKATALRYLEAGHHVVGTFLPGSHNETLEAHKAFTRLEVNLMEEAPVAEALAGLGMNIHVAVLTVGGFAMHNLHHTKGGDLDKMLKLNLYTAFFTVKAVFAHMEAHGEGGRIVMVSSKPGMEPALGTHTVAYTLSKATLPALAEIVNASGKDAGIVASIVAPSIIDTPINRKAMPDADFSQWVTPKQIAEVIYFATTESGHILRDPVFKLYGDA